MEKKDFLRLSLILNDNQSTTFKNKLKRLITEVLREHYGDGMTIQEIVIELRDNFALEFSANEILSIIKGDEKTFVIKHKNSDQILNKYDLSILAYTKACERSSGVSLNERKIECFTLAEQKKIETAALNSKKTKMFGIVLCLYTGLRIGELIALQWKDIDLQ